MESPTATVVANLLLKRWASEFNRRLATTVAVGDSIKRPFFGISYGKCLLMYQAIWFMVETMPDVNPLFRFEWFATQCVVDDADMVVTTNVEKCVLNSMPDKVKRAF